MVDAINVILFPDLSPLAGSEAALLAMRWDAIIGGGALTSFAYTSLLLDKHSVELFTSWGAAEKQIKAWGCSVTYPGILGRTPHHIRGIQPRRRKCLRQGKPLVADAAAAYFTRFPRTHPPYGFQQELPSGIGAAIAGPLSRFREAQAQPRHRKLLAGDYHPPRGLHSSGARRAGPTSGRSHRNTPRPTQTPTTRGGTEEP